MKNIRSFFVLILSLLFFSNSLIVPQDEKETFSKLRLVADKIIKDATFRFIDEKTSFYYNSTENIPQDAKLKPESPYNDWRYWNGVLNIAMINLSDVLREPSYKEFAVRNVEFNFDNYKYFEENYNNEGKWNYPYGQRFITEELDDCGAMGAGVIEVYKIDQQVRYLEYINESADHIMNKQTRLNDKTFVRHFPYKWTLWADDLYMGLSFISRMGELTGDMKYFSDAAHQVIQYHKYVFNEPMGIMHHFWYSDVDRRSAAFWGRANGWAMLAQIDLLERLPDNHPKKEILVSLLQKHILGLSRYQGNEGMWHQLLNKNDSYLETSCTAMFTYTALRAWEGLLKRITEDGQVEGICAGTVTSDDLVHYYHRPTPLNDIHGLGTILLAGAEILRLIK